MAIPMRFKCVHALSYNLVFITSVKTTYYILRAGLNWCLLRSALKTSIGVVSHSSSANAFHRYGAARVKNGRPYRTRLYCGTVSRAQIEVTDMARSE